MMPDLEEYISESHLVGMNIHSNCRRSQTISCSKVVGMNIHSSCRGSQAISCSKVQSIVRYCKAETSCTIMAVSFCSVLQ